MQSCRHYPFRLFFLLFLHTFTPLGWGRRDHQLRNTVCTHHGTWPSNHQRYSRPRHRDHTFNFTPRSIEIWQSSKFCRVCHSSLELSQTHFHPPCLFLQHRPTSVAVGQSLDRGRVIYGRNDEYMVSWKRLCRHTSPPAQLSVSAGRIPYSGRCDRDLEILAYLLLVGHGSHVSIVHVSGAGEESHSPDSMLRHHGHSLSILPHSHRAALDARGGQGQQYREC